MTQSAPGVQVAMGDGLQSLGHLEQAAQHYRRALTSDPRFAAAYMGLAAVAIASGDFEEGLREYRQALELDPDNPVIYQNFLLATHYADTYDPGAMFAAHQHYEARYVRGQFAARAPHTNSKDADRKLRVGYVSADFRRHSVAYFVEPLLEAHDPQQFDITCYSQLATPDDVTRRLEARSAQWRRIYGATDDEVAELIRQDRIDVLVDLGGHTNPRLMVFARKPAPVQVTYLGYPNTTGLSAIDYRITDAWADPCCSSADAHHTEKLVRLSTGFTCYRPPCQSPAVGSLPSLSTTQITFASFNALPKMSARVVAVWSSILRSVPESRLLLKATALQSPEVRRRVRTRFASHGVASERIELLAQTRSTSDHLALYNRVDVGLDPFPYSGATTTCEALWMGVPVVTLAGETHAGRVGVSILSRLGHPELIANSEADYVNMAVGLAHDGSRLKGLRSSLREQMRHSPLMDSVAVTRSLEAAYRRMWQAWCAA